MTQITETNAVAHRYAKALLQQAIDTKSLDLVVADMHSLRAMLDSNEDFSRIIKSPALPKAEAKAVLTAVLEKSGCGDAIKGLAVVLCDNRRAFALGATLNAFDTLVATHKGIVKAQVVSATELTDTHKGSVGDAVAKVVGGDVEISYSVNPSILGGLIVKIGSKMLDASIQTKLEKLTLDMKGA